MRSSRAVLVAACVLTAMWPAVASAQSTFDINIDRPGLDYRTFEIQGGVMSLDVV